MITHKAPVSSHKQPLPSAREQRKGMAQNKYKCAWASGLLDKPLGCSTSLVRLLALRRLLNKPLCMLWELL